MGRVNSKGVNYPSPKTTVALNKIKKAINKGNKKNGHEKALKGKAWKGVTCPVCLEIPHNSVLLLCSSYHKGCRPYMCATGNRFSNCLEQYKKAYAKDEKSDKPAELLCPLCRGQVKGWTVVEDARKYLNSKKRACMNDNCLFLGSYRQLKKHVKAIHPRAKPRAIDPVLEEKWKKLEVERDRRDVITTVMATTPGAVVYGDYVIEPYNNYGNDIDEYSDSDDSLDGVFNIGTRDMSNLQPRSVAAITGQGLRSLYMMNRVRRIRGVSRRRQTQD